MVFIPGYSSLLIFMPLLNCNFVFFQKSKNIAYFFSYLYYTTYLILIVNHFTTFSLCSIMVSNP